MKRIGFIGTLATDGTTSLQMTQALRDNGAHDALLPAPTAINKRLEAEP